MARLSEMLSPINKEAELRKEINDLKLSRQELTVTCYGLVYEFYEAKEEVYNLREENQQLRDQLSKITSNNTIDYSCVTSNKLVNLRNVLTQITYKGVKSDDASTTVEDGVSTLRRHAVSWRNTDEVLPYTAYDAPVIDMVLARDDIHYYRLYDDNTFMVYFTSGQVLTITNINSNDLMWDQAQNILTINTLRTSI